MKPEAENPVRPAVQSLPRTIQWLVGVLIRLIVCIPFLLIEGILDWVSESCGTLSAKCWRLRHYVHEMFPLPWMTDLENAETKRELQMRKKLLEDLRGA